MKPEPVLLIILISLLILASGFFSLFERALKAVQKPRLQKELDEAARNRGRVKSYRRVVHVIENPDRYLFAARFWIITLRTLAAILAGFSLSPLVAMHSPQNPLAGAKAAVVIVFLFIAAVVTIFAILLMGSLLPRLIVRRDPERITALILPLFEMFVLPLRPFLFLVRIASERLRLARSGQKGMTEDELRHALIEGEKSGIVESKERTMVEGVFYLGDRPLGTFMTHRSEIQWLDIKETPLEIRGKVLEYRDQRCFPVVNGALDAIIGAAYLEDIILDLSSDSPAGLRGIMKKALFAPETMPALKAFESFKRGKADYLFVMDEYGGFAGMVSVRNLIEEIVGELAPPTGEDEQIVQQEDGSWLAGGGLNIDDAAEILSLPGLAVAGDYHTLAGFVLSLAEELPRAGDSFSYQDCRFTVVDMDGNRINKIKVKREE